MDSSNFYLPERGSKCLPHPIIRFIVDDVDIRSAHTYLLFSRNKFSFFDFVDNQPYFTFRCELDILGGNVALHNNMLTIIPDQGSIYYSFNNNVC